MARIADVMQGANGRLMGWAKLVGNVAVTSYVSARARYASLACHFKGSESMRTVLLIIVILLLLGALPTWPYSQGWGYYPSGGLGLIFLIVLLVVLLR